jgi:ArsR family transcriptional regulator
VNILNAPEEKISLLLHTLGQPVRIRILLAISDDEACVCHLETMLGLRQAYISQHLMAMRNAGILTTRRDGRFIFYCEYSDNECCIKIPQIRND